MVLSVARPKATVVMIGRKLAGKYKTTAVAKKASVFCKLPVSRMEIAVPQTGQRCDSAASVKVPQVWQDANPFSAAVPFGYFIGGHLVEASLVESNPKVLPCRRD